MPGARRQVGSVRSPCTAPFVLDTLGVVPGAGILFREGSVWPEDALGLHAVFAHRRHIVRNPDSLGLSVLQPAESCFLGAPLN